MKSSDIGAIVRIAREGKGLSQGALAKRIGVKQQSIDAIERGETTRSKFLPEIARELGIPPKDVGLPAETASTEPPQQQPLSIGDPFGPRDFPIYSAAEGGPGEILRHREAVDYWPRPVNVQQVRGAYGMYIVGESMVPEFRPGQVAIINPNLPHIGGFAYIFYGETEDGAVRASIKLLRKQTADAWHVTQHNPPSGQKHDFTMPRKTWHEAHRIVGRQDSL